MSLEALRALLRWHAVAAWLATAALIAAAAAHASERTRRLTVALSSAAAALSLAAGGLGLALDEGYRMRLRQRIFVAAPGLGWLFERKLHLAVAAVLLAVAGAAITLAGRRLPARPGGAEVARELRRAARLASTAAALLALAAAIASVLVGEKMRF